MRRETAENSSVWHVWISSMHGIFFLAKYWNYKVYKKNIKKNFRKESMLDAREAVEAIIDRLQDDMEIATGVETVPQANYNRMQFNWRKVKSTYQG